MPRAALGFGSRRYPAVYNGIAHLNYLCLIQLLPLYWPFSSISRNSSLKAPVSFHLTIPYTTHKTDARIHKMNAQASSVLAMPSKSHLPKAGE
jgi:hypothetical protein